MTFDDDKVRENRLRRTAERRGWKLERSRRRDPDALGFGRYRLEAEDGYVVVSKGTKIKDPRLDEFTMDLDGVEEALKFYECAVLRCGRQVRELVQSRARGRVIEAMVCTEHFPEIRDGVEGTDWVMIYEERTYIIVVGEDLRILQSKDRG